MELTMKSHAPLKKHVESLVPKRQRGRPALHCWPSPGPPENAFGFQAATDVGTDIC